MVWLISVFFLHIFMAKLCTIRWSMRGRRLRRAPAGRSSASVAASAQTSQLGIDVSGSLSKPLSEATRCELDTGPHDLLPAKCTPASSCPVGNDNGVVFVV